MGYFVALAVAMLLATVFGACGKQETDRASNPTQVIEPTPTASVREATAEPTAAPLMLAPTPTPDAVSFRGSMKYLECNFTTTPIDYRMTDKEKAYWRSLNEQDRQMCVEDMRQQAGLAARPTALTLEQYADAVCLISKEEDQLAQASWGEIRANWQTALDVGTDIVPPSLLQDYHFATVDLLQRVHDVSGQFPQTENYAPNALEMLEGVHSLLVRQEQARNAVEPWVWLVLIGEGCDVIKPTHKYTPSPTPTPTPIP